LAGPLDQSGRDAVDVDVVLAHFNGQRLGRREDAALGGRVVHAARLAAEGDDRGDVHDLAGIAPDEVGQGGADDVHRAAEVDIENPVEDLDVEAFEAAHAGTGAAPGGIHDDVEPAEGFCDGVHAGRHGFVGADVHGLREAPAAHGAHLLGDLFRRFGVHVDHRDVGARRRQFQGDGPADGAAPAGHDCDPVCQFHASFLVSRGCCRLARGRGMARRSRWEV
jgi:hypothetical protein